MERRKIDGFVGVQPVDVDGTPHREITFYAVYAGEASVLVTEEVLSAAGVRLVSQTETLISATVTVDTINPYELNPTDFVDPRELPGLGEALYFHNSRNMNNPGNI